MSSDDFWKETAENRKRHLEDADKLRSHDLWKFWKEAQRRIGEQYERMHHRVSREPNTAGEQGESDWKKLLGDWLPAAYEIVTRGRLIFDDGKTSPELDLLILKPGYPRGMLDYKYFLADAVVAAFECKRTLTKSHIAEAVRTASIIQAKLKPRLGDPRAELFGPIFFGLLAHTHSWTRSKSTPIRNIEETLDSSSHEAVQHPRELIDIVCVGDLCAWYVWKGAVIFNRLAAGWRRSATSPEDVETLKTIMGVIDGTLTPDALNIGDDFSKSRAFLEVLGSVMMEPGVFSGEAIPPVGLLVCSILEHLAWEDPTLRPTARIFRKYRRTFEHSTFAWGYWGYEVLSLAVGEKLLAGEKPAPSDVDWDSWSL